MVVPYFFFRSFGLNHFGACICAEGKDVAEHHLSYTPLLQYMYEFRKDNGIGEKICHLVQR
jgi:hypothetical protein